MDSTKNEIISQWPDNILLLNQDGKIVEVSNRLCHWLLWLKSDLIGEYAHDILCAPARSFMHTHENCPLNINHTIKTPSELNKDHEGETLIVDKDGAYHHVEYVTERFTNFEAATSIVRLIDDSRLLHTINELKRMSYFVDESPFPLAEFSDIGTIEFSNPKMTELLLHYGYDDNGNMALLPVNLEQLLQTIIESKNSIDNVEVKMVDGQYWSWFLYYVISGNESGVHGIASNITERKKNEKMEQELIRISDEIKENTRQEELAKLIHEFRSPLNSVVGFASILKKQLADRLSEKEASFLNMIEQGGKKLATQISESLISATDNRLANKLDISVFDSKYIINNIIQQLAPLAMNKDLKLTMKCASVKLCSDQGKLNQILVNLVDNAIKYTQKGEVSITGVVDDQYYIISIIDTGRGLTPEEQNSVFTEFTRTDGVENIEGTGLGLSVVIGLAKLIKSEVKLESQFGKGSTFSIHLPYKSNS